MGNPIQGAVHTAEGGVSGIQNPPNMGNPIQGAVHTAEEVISGIQNHPNTEPIVPTTKKRGKRVSIDESYDPSDIAKPPPYKDLRSSRKDEFYDPDHFGPIPYKGQRKSRNSSKSVMHAEPIIPAIDESMINEFFAGIHEAMDKENEELFASLMVLLVQPIDEVDIVKRRLIMESRMKELRMLLEKKTIRPVMHNELNAVEMQKRLLTKLFTILKRETFKSRAVAGGMGRPQEREEGMSSASPTAKWESVLLGLRVALEEKRDVSTIDFTAAFLNADLPTQISNGVEFRRILELTPDLVQLILEIEPSWATFICPGRGKNGTSCKGSMFFIIDKALYGMIESSLAWFRELSKTLHEMGFTQSESDPCVFHSYINGDRTSIIVYVDDLMVLARTRERTIEIRIALEKKYEKITIKDFESTDELTYLGIQIKRTIDEQKTTTAFELFQEIYCNKMIDELGLRDIANPFESTALPYTTDLFKVDPDSPPLNKADSKWYSSAVENCYILPAKYVLL